MEADDCNEDDLQDSDWEVNQQLPTEVIVDILHVNVNFWPPFQPFQGSRGYSLGTWDCGLLAITQLTVDNYNSGPI